jgi:long-subunit acyl-CoA synthetase (AMP-forming)
VYEQMLSLGIQPLAGYGLTETTALYSISPIDRHKQGSAGQADLVESKVKVSERGTLMISGPGVFKGYYQEPERTAEVLKDGWFDTGDVGYIDDDGFVFITGRASRTIVLSSGKKIAPEEIEDKLLAIPGFREAIVSGNGETREIKAEIYAVVSEDTVKRQVELLNRSLPVYQRIKTVIVRDEPFPRTSSGKIRLHSEPVEPPCEQNTIGERVHGTVRVVRRMCAKHPHRWRMSFLVLLVAMAVLVFNIVPHLLTNAGIKLPSMVAKTIEFVGDCGEILLALLVIVGFFISRKLFPAEDE